MNFFTTNYTELRQQLEAAGNPSATLGEIYEKGLDGSEPDLQRAVEIYKSCGRFDYEARYHYAKLLMYAPRDSNALGISFTARQIKKLVLGDADRCPRLSVLAYRCLKPKFSFKDKKEIGYAYLYSAAAKKNPEAIAIILNLYEKGVPLPEKFRLLLDVVYLNDSAVDDPVLLYYLGRYSEAPEAFYRNIRSNSFECLKYLLRMPLANLNITDELLETLLQLRAVQINDTAMSKIARCYLEGIHVTQDINKGLLVLMKARQFENARRCTCILAETYLHANPLNDNLAFAISLLDSIKEVSPKAVMVLTEHRYRSSILDEPDTEEMKRGYLTLIRGMNNLYSAELCYQVLYTLLNHRTFNSDIPMNDDEDIRHDDITVQYRILKICRNFCYVPKILDVYLKIFKHASYVVCVKKKCPNFIAFFKGLVKQGYRNPVLLYTIADLYDELKGRKSFEKCEKYLKKTLATGYKPEKVIHYLVGIYLKNRDHFIFDEGKREIVFAFLRRYGHHSDVDRLLQTSYEEYWYL